MTRHDLHCHSNVSDGTLTPAALVARAAERGTTMLALTDHDDTSGLAEARAAAAGHGLTLVDGVEISVTWRGYSLHVVGLDIEPGNAVLQEGLHMTREGRVERARKIALALDGLGYAGSFDGALQFAANPAMIGRAHFARFLVRGGMVRNAQSAFKRLLGAGAAAYVPHVWAQLDAAVGWIRASGGLAVLAHPGRYPLDDATMRELLSEFRELGGAAIEIVPDSHRPQLYRKFCQHAQFYGFAASTGSDFHSPGESYFDLGAAPPLPSGCVPVWERFKRAG